MFIRRKKLVIVDSQNFKTDDLTCPKCSQIGIVLNSESIKCYNCDTVWKVTEEEVN